jgi:hypothetical protein
MEREKVIEHLEGLGGVKCPICKGRNWDLLDEFFQLLNSDGVKCLRIVPIICPECGNIQQFAYSVLDKKRTNSQSSQK